jgi:hypothetical protein
MSFIIPLLATSFLLTGPAPALGATYSLIESHAGSSFFDGWIYETGYDNTSKSDNQAIIKVDNSTSASRISLSSFDCDGIDPPAPPEIIMQ